MSGNRRSVHRFPETVEKDILRARDFALLDELYKRKGEKLTYCGLAGGDALDIVRWRGLLHDVVIVEKPIQDDDERAAFETTLALKLGTLVGGNVRIVFSDVWDYLASDSFAQLAPVPDVINLDFCGGMIYKLGLSYPVQRRAFQRMFEASAGHGVSMVVLLTLMPRDLGKSTYEEYLDENYNSIAQGIVGRGATELRARLSANRAFHARSNLTLLKACIPLLLIDIGRASNYSVRLEYVRLYTKMIHFAFSCNFVPSKLGMLPDVASTLHVLNLPVRKLLSDGQEERCEVPPQILLAH